MVPSLAHIAKKHRFPRNLSTFLAKMFYAKKLPFFEMPPVTIAETIYFDLFIKWMPEFREQIHPTLIVVNYHFDDAPISAKPNHWYRIVLQIEILLSLLSYESKGIISQSRIRDYHLKRRFILPAK